MGACEFIQSLFYVVTIFDFSKNGLINKGFRLLNFLRNSYFCGSWARSTFIFFTHFVSIWRHRRQSFLSRYRKSLPFMNF